MGSVAPALFRLQLLHWCAFLLRIHYDLLPALGRPGDSRAGPRAGTEFGHFRAAWRLGNEHQHSGVSILRQGLQGSSHAVTTDTRVDIAPAYTDGLGHAYALACQQATHLLQSGPRRRNEAHRSAGELIGKPQGDTIEYCRATVWPHHQHTLVR